MPALSDIVIQSPDAARLGRFLAELLDLDIREEDQRILLRGPDFGLAIQSCPREELRAGPGLEFSAENEDELHSLWQRYVFVMYRLQGERHGPSAPLARRKIGGEEQVTLLLKDPDHRLWPFKAVKSLQ